MRDSRPGCPGGALLLLLPLLLQPPSARADLKVSVPPSTLRASPFSDLRLPCNFSDPSRAITLSGLSVAWKRGEEIIAEYVDGGAKQGLEMAEERLLAGDASLRLSGLRETDSGLYTCRVFMTPDKDQGSFQLKVEAEPHIALGSTKMQLARAGAVTCTVSGFYPVNISVDWLKNGAVVKGPQTSVHQDSENRLYRASSILELTPSAADANANFSCRVTHQSLEGPLRENFQLQLQALPSLQILTWVSKNTLDVLECLVSGFYPQDVEVHWLRNGMRQMQIQSKPQRLPNGTFLMHSMIRPGEMDQKVRYVCRVQHKAWDTPLERTAHWQPKEEGEEVTCPTPKCPPCSGTEGMPHSCSPTPVPTSPTSAAGTVPVWPWLVFGIGVLLSLAGGILLYLAVKKGNSKLFPETKSSPESEECMLKTQTNQASASASL